LSKIVPFSTNRSFIIAHQSLKENLKNLELAFYRKKKVMNPFKLDEIKLSYFYFLKILRSQI